jgi:AcrR family transcriptional regulator
MAEWCKGERREHMPTLAIRKRLSSADRSESILAAARDVFAEHGYEGAKTQQIANAANVSEALVFRHFSSKQVLYKAVLKRVIQDQDAAFERLGLMSPSTESFINTINEFMLECVAGGASQGAHNARILLASLAGDGSYARLVYKRAQKLWLKAFEESIAAAYARGDATAPLIHPANAHAFIEHVGTMLLGAHLSDKPAAPYAGGKERIAREAVWFVCRGVGITDAALARHFAAKSAGADRKKEKTALQPAHPSMPARRIVSRKR